MTAHIYFCGEIVADMIEKENGSNNFTLGLGGAHFNSARGAKIAADALALDATIGYVGPIADDYIGQRFFDTLTKEGVDTNGVLRCTYPVTVAMVSLKKDNNEFAFYEAETAAKMIGIENHTSPAIEAASTRIFCFGSISTIMAPAKDAWVKFAKTRAQDSVVFYDLNARPTIAKDAEKYRAIVLEWAQVAHIMKASDQDVAWTYPGMTLKDVAKIWLDAGAKVAVFTKGENGAEIYTKTESAAAPCPSPKVEIKNTVGAGDNFNAGFVTHLVQIGKAKSELLADLSKDELVKLINGANQTAIRHLERNNMSVMQAKVG